MYEYEKRKVFNVMEKLKIPYMPMKGDFGTDFLRYLNTNGINLTELRKALGICTKTEYNTIIKEGRIKRAKARLEDPVVYNSQLINRLAGRQIKPITGEQKVRESGIDVIGISGPDPLSYDSKLYYYVDRSDLPKIAALFAK